MIKKLTPEQEATIIPFREKWRAIGLSTEGFDKERLKAAVTEMYKILGKEPPIFIFCPSPAFCILQINYFKYLKLQEGKSANLWDNLWDNIGANLWDNLWDNLGANLRDNLGANLRANLGANLRDNLGANLRANLRENLWANLRANLGDNLWDNLGDNLWDNLGDNLWDNIGDNLWDNLGANLRANLRENLGDNLWANLRANLGDNLGDNLWDNIGDNLWDNIGANLWDNLWDNIGANLWDNLRENLGANLRDNLGANLRANLRENLGDNLGDKEIPKELTEYHGFYTEGQTDSYWICFYKFMETIGIKYAKRDQQILDLWAETAQSCSFFWTFEKFVFVSDRPEKLSFNDDRRMHNAHGPSFRFRDGWEGYYLNGVQFPKELWKKVVSREMPMSEVLAIEDIDQRTQAMKFAKDGLREFYKSQKGEMIDSFVKMDSKGAPIKYELWEIPAGDIFSDTVHFAIYNCPSRIKNGKDTEYSKGVPPFKTVAEALAWGMSDEKSVITPDEWKKLVPLVHES